MRLRKVLCDVSFAAAVGAMVAVLLPGCATTPRMDWRQAVKAGDYKYAYNDLFETWRSGTPDVKAEAVRYAWRDPRIIDAARQDALDNIRRVADGHEGDLPSLGKAIKTGPLEDRIEFAKLVNRSLDVDREILSAHQKRVPAQAAQPAQQVQPAEIIRPVAKAQPQASSHPAERTKPVETTPPAQVIPPAASVAPATKTQPAAKIQPAEKIEPAPKVEARTAENATIADLLAQAAEAKRRATWRCKGASACGKAMASAQDFVALNSNMRIEVATDTRIETYKPIEIGHLGMKVSKVLRDGDEAELQLAVTCRVGALRKLCPSTELRVYTAFPVFMQSTMRQ